MFTGLYRLGRYSPSSFLGVEPDVSVHAKLLTGGLVPLCTTLASEDIFEAFSSDEKTDALLHGHSYTAHPIGCQVALESLKEMQKMDKRGDWNWAKSQGWSAETGKSSSLSTTAAKSRNDEVWSSWPLDLVEGLSRNTAKVSGVWALGSVIAIHLRDDAGTGYSSNAALGLRNALATGDENGLNGPWNIHSRVLGNVLYLMASQKTTEQGVQQISNLLLESLK